MMDLLTLQLDDLGTGRGPVLAVLAVVLTAITVVMLRDLFVWFEALGRDAETTENDGAAIAELGEGEGAAKADDNVEVPQPSPPTSFSDRRSPNTTPTGFGRRKTDVMANSEAQAA